MPKPTILLADNDPVFLSIAQEFLEREGYWILPVSDPGTARRILAQEPIALAVLDIRLADDSDDNDKSGLNLVRDTTGASSVPKIVLTRFPGYEDARDALRPGKRGQSFAVDYVAKQDGLEALLAAIQRFLVETKIFLCYARSDESQVSQFYERLQCAGFTPWMDKKCIMGGEEWETAIRRAIQETHFFVACISRKSVNRRGFMQKEIKLALSIWDEMLEDDIYLIPVRLEECNMTHEKLRKLQWVDIFHPNGFHKLVQAIRIGMKKRE